MSPVAQTVSAITVAHMCRTKPHLYRGWLNRGAVLSEMATLTARLAGIGRRFLIFGGGTLGRFFAAWLLWS
jgi:hypothetical protein